MKKKYKIILVAAVAVMILAYAVSTMLTPLKVDTKKAVRGDLMDTFKEEGVLRPSDKWTLNSTVSGDIVKAPFDIGQRVKKGDIIVQIKSKSLETQLSQLQSQRSSLVSQRDYQVSNDSISKKQQLLQLESQLNDIKEAERKVFGTNANTQTALSVENAKLHFDQAKKSYDDLKALYDIGAISSKELDDANILLKDVQMAYDLAVASASKDSKTYYATIKDLIGAQISLLNISNKSLSAQFDASISEVDASISRVRDLLAECAIKSPVDGVLSDIAVSKGQSVDPSSYIGTVYSPDKLLIEAYPLAEDTIGLKPGMKVRLLSSSGEDKGHATITLVSPSAVEKTSTIGLVERRVRVAASPEGLDASYGSGFTLDVEFSITVSKDVISVPSSSLIPWKSGYAIYIKNASGKAEIRVVETGKTASGMVEIKSGLKDNETYVVDPRVTGLKDGVAID
jgi:HlyD family secretion protein